MNKTLAKHLDFPFYLWLMAMYPVLFLYSENLGLVIDQEVPPVLISILAGTTVTFFCINACIKNTKLTAFSIGVVLLCFSLSGHVYGLFLAPSAVHIRVEAILWTKFVLFITITLIIVVHRFRTADLIRTQTKTTNLIFAALLAAPLITILSKSLSHSKAVFGRQAIVENASPIINDSASHPDIYYIVPDGYPSDRWLQQQMNYDNSDFTNALKARGFVIAQNALSNYGTTLHSLASTLNMRMFDMNRTTMNDLDYLRVSIAEAEILRYIRSRRYSYVQLLSGYLLPSPLAHINRDFTPYGPIDIKIDPNDLSALLLEGPPFTDLNTVDIGSAYKQSFIKLYLDTTLLRLLSPSLNQRWKTDAYQQYDLFSPERFISTIEELEPIAAMPDATFTLVHLMKPHEPSVFDAKGNILEETWQPSHERYFAEFEFVNMMFLQMIDTILNNSENEPVIIFQADHGSMYGRVWSEDARLTHFEAYAAYHLPMSNTLSIPQPFTLINSFPLIINEIFGADFPIQDDKLIDIPRGYKAPFEQIDVTEDFLIR